MDQGDKAEAPRPRQPNINDYVAGAMLANGIVWIWRQVLPYIVQGGDQFIASIVSEVSIVVFVLSGYIASRQVCKRADIKHLLVAVKLAAVCWVMSLFIMFTFPLEPDFSLAFPLLVCFAAGCVLGGYMAVRARLKRRRQAIS
jgi:hypothetical protein